MFDAVGGAMEASGRPRRLAPRAATREELARVHDAGVSRRDRRHRRAGGDARCRHVHVARVAGDRGAGRRRGRAGRRARARRAASPRSRSSVRRATTPSATARWASACSTTSRSRRPRRCAPRRRRASRSSTSTCTTATGRSGCSTTIPRVLYVSTHQFPFYPGTGAADEIGTRRGRGLHRQRAARGGRHRRRLSIWSTASRRCRCSTSSRPQLMLVSAGYDAHERDPLASMRMTTAGYARHRAAACRTWRAARRARVRHRGGLRPAALWRRASRRRSRRSRGRGSDRADAASDAAMRPRGERGAGGGARGSGGFWRSDAPSAESDAGPPALARIQAR